jgi:CubicO group peptidase (beta-lactamase class C family)
MRDDLNRVLDSIMALGIREGAAPGGSLIVGRYGQVVHRNGYGRLDTAQASAAVDANSIYDLASLTKVISTTTAAMILNEQGLLDLDRTVASYLPEFNAPDKATITVRHLLIHEGGLEAFAALYRDTKGLNEYLAKINTRPVRSAPGTNMVYSDWDLDFRADARPFHDRKDFRSARHDEHDVQSGQRDLLAPCRSNGD